MPRVSGAWDVAQVNDPATPVAGREFLYIKSDGLLYTKKSDGTVSSVGKVIVGEGAPSSVPSGVVYVELLNGAVNEFWTT